MFTARCGASGRQAFPLLHAPQIRSEEMAADLDDVVKSSGRKKVKCGAVDSSGFSP